MMCNQSCLSGKVSCDMECYAKSLHMQGGVNTSLSVLLGIITAIAIVANLFLLLLILKEKSLHTMPNIFIINLALGDLLNSIVLLPLDLDEFVKGKFAHSKDVCTLVYMVFFISLPASSVNLVLLTVERYIIINYPFYHSHLFSKPKVAFLLSAVWGYVCTLGFFAVSPLLNHHTVVVNGICQVTVSDPYNDFWTATNLALPLILIVALNIQIFHTANKHLRGLKTRNVPTERSNSFRRQSLVANIKAAKTTALLVGVFVICWIPYLIMLAVNRVCGMECYVKYRAVLKGLIVLNYSNMAWNPILYGVLNKSIRQHAMILIKALIPRRSKLRKSRISQVSTDISFLPENNECPRFSQTVAQTFQII